MFTMINGQSNNLDPKEASLEAIRQCQEQIGEQQPDVGIFYTSFLDIDHRELLRIISEAFPGMQLIGCTTDGEYSNSMGMTEDSVVLSLLMSDKVKFSVGLGLGVSSNTCGAIRQAAEQAQSNLSVPASLCIALPDGLHAFTNPVAECLGEILGEQVAVVGGTAGDGYRIKETLQFYGTEVYTNALTMLLLGGELKFSIGRDSGWKPIGKIHVVTEAKGAGVTSVDGQNIIDFYKELIGTELLQIQDVTPFSIAVFDDNEDEFYLRAPAQVDNDSRRIYFAGTTPEGSRFKMTEMGRDEIAEAATSSVQKAWDGYPGNKPSAVLTFSCTSRRQILGTRTFEEQDALYRILGPGVPFNGFYTYGEIAPLKPGGAPMFHNGTFVTLCIGDE